MSVEWLIREGREKLLLFCSGWGMDATPFRMIKSNNYDVLILYDYGVRQSTDEILTALSPYSHRTLLAWSMGIVHGQLLFEKFADLFHRRIALNGTLQPVHDQFGIPAKVFYSTLEHLDEKTLVKFYRRMCKPSRVFDVFFENRPKRRMPSIQRELQEIPGLPVVPEDHQSLYTEVFISQKDFIFPPENQMRFWQSIPVNQLKSSHFPFYDCDDWDAFLSQVNE